MYPWKLGNIKQLDVASRQLARMEPSKKKVDIEIIQNASRFLKQNILKRKRDPGISTWNLAILYCS